MYALSAVCMQSYSQMRLLLIVARYLAAAVKQPYYAGTHLFLYYLCTSICTFGPQADNTIVLQWCPADGQGEREQAYLQRHTLREIYSIRRKVRVCCPRCLSGCRYGR